VSPHQQGPDRPPSPWADATVAPPGALAGLRVLDGSNLIAGPLTSTFLADFGADVIKVEHPVHGDPLREHGQRHLGEPLWWKYIGRNKRCITLDLHTEAGQDIFRRIAVEADVVIENYRPGTMARWGLAYHDLVGDNPGLVMLHITGFGQAGPKSGQPGFGTLAEAMSGFAFRNGQPDGPPTLPPFGLADTVSAMQGAFAVMVALREREASGRGQEIDLAIVESLLPVLEPQVTEYDQTGVIMQRTGNRSLMNAPRNVYRARDGHWVAISTSTQSTADRLLALTAQPALADEPWFRSAQGRAAHVDEIDAVVGAWVGSLDGQAVLAACRDAGAPATAIYAVEDVVADEQFAFRESTVPVPDEVLGAVRMPNVFPKLTRTPGGIRWSGPAPGTHNAEVLIGLGIDGDGLEKLRADGVI
jgi:formyl-CoA transferase